MKRKVVLITGATGQLGTDLVKVLSDDHNVIATSSSDFDIVNLNTTKGFILEHNPDIIVHPAAFTDVDSCEGEKDKAFRVNGLGTRNVSLVARQVGAKLFYISTDYVFDGEKEPMAADSRILSFITH